MNQCRFNFIFLLLLFVNPYIKAQIRNSPETDSLFSMRGEIYFRFSVNSPNDIKSFTRIVSIDKVKDNDIYAYANKKGFIEFLKYHFPFTVLRPPGMLLPASEINLYHQKLESKGRKLWNFYPTYDQYVNFMYDFANDFPGICKLDTIGISVMGRLLLAVKISSNVQQKESEPRVFYTAAIHGDETTGYVLMLHLIDYLLQNYGSDQNITELINTTEIFINPLANPDGTYFGGNNSVYGAIRFNANFIDINRNFPDPKLGLHPDNENWQCETQAFMTYAQNNKFVMSANFHGGSEVFNYPWDTWERLTSDDLWWQLVGREWADTVHKYGPPGYFTDENNGITNGHAWYEINGGRQDYMNFWQHCREVTVEISNAKLPPANQLDSFWAFNYHSFLNYIEQSHFGFNGLITDSATSLPISAKVFINRHDSDSSEVFSILPSGFFARPVFEGLYDVTFSASGYSPETMNNIAVTNGQTLFINVKLRPYTHGQKEEEIHAVRFYPNPGTGVLEMRVPAGLKGDCMISIINNQGKEIFSENVNLDLDNMIHSLNLKGIPDGLYYLKMKSGGFSLVAKIIISHD